MKILFFTSSSPHLDILIAIKDCHHFITSSLHHFTMIPTPAYLPLLYRLLPGSKLLNYSGTLVLLYSCTTSHPHLANIHIMSLSATLRTQSNILKGLSPVPSAFIIQFFLSTYSWRILISLTPWLQWPYIPGLALPYWWRWASGSYLFAILMAFDASKALYWPPLQMLGGCPTTTGTKRSPSKTCTIVLETSCEWAQMHFPLEIPKPFVISSEPGRIGTRYVQSEYAYWMECRPQF